MYMPLHACTLALHLHGMAPFSSSIANARKHILPRRQLQSADEPHGSLISSSIEAAPVLCTLKPSVSSSDSSKNPDR
jgi:hypothetical protein